MTNRPDLRTALGDEMRRKTERAAEPRNELDREFAEHHFGQLDSAVQRTQQDPTFLAGLTPYERRAVTARAANLANRRGHEQ